MSRITSLRAPLRYKKKMKQTAGNARRAIECCRRQNGGTGLRTIDTIHP